MGRGPILVSHEKFGALKKEKEKEEVVVIKSLGSTGLEVSTSEPGIS